MFFQLKNVSRLAVMAAAVVAGLPAAGLVTLVTPDWKITLTDFGYSDLLLDNTPGFRGREYLSGEWGAAVGYQVGELPPVTPRWLEPNFIYPDWRTNSNFVVTTPIRQIAVNDDGMPVAESVIQNEDLEITLRCEVVDTVMGTPMGDMADSLGGGGTSLRSNRFVLKQTYTLRNISNSGVSGLQFFQFLHSLNGQRGHFDQRVYPGPLATSRHDVTLSGMDPWSVGVPSAPEGLEDYVGFHSAVAPSGFEIGHYGIWGNGVDNHVEGKPSDGVHLSIEANWLESPYDTRMGRDAFEPANRWVSGAQRWDMPDLAVGETTSHEVILSLRTGTRVGWEGSSGGCGGGASYQGGLDFEFAQVTEPGLCFAQSSRADAREIGILVNHGVIAPPDFPALGALTQMWELKFTGQHEGGVNLTFACDPGLLPQALDPSELCIYQYDGTRWLQLPTTVNSALNKISVTTSDLTVYALGAVSGISHEVATESLPNGAGEVTGSGTYVDGVNVTLVATAADGYVFSNWTENGQVVAESPSHTFAIHGDHVFQAHFMAVGSGLAVSTKSIPAFGGVTAGDGVYQAGAEVTVEAVPNPGYKFEEWLANGVQVSGTPQYAFSAETSVTLTAVFGRVFTVTAAAEPAQGGDVIYEGVYGPDQLAELKARANPGFVFSEWTEAGVFVSTDPTLRYVVSSDRTLVANFVPLVDITVETSSSQAGTCSGGGSLMQGSQVEVSANANPGYIFLNWTVDGEVVADTPDYTFHASTSQDLIAVFEAVPGLTLGGPASGPLTLAWPVTNAGWILQESSDLSSGWIDSTRNVQIVDDIYRVEISGLSERGFFRLRRP